MLHRTGYANGTKLISPYLKQHRSPIFDVFQLSVSHCPYEWLSRKLYGLSVPEIWISSSPSSFSLLNTNIQPKQGSSISFRRVDDLSSSSSTTYRINQILIDFHCMKSLPSFTLLSKPLNRLKRGLAAPVCPLPSARPHRVPFCNNNAAGLWKLQWGTL